MIGELMLKKEDIKDYLECYYKKIYEEAYIRFIDIDCSHNDTGIVLTRSFKLNGEKTKLIEEQLEKEDLIEAFNNIFESEGYITKEIIPNEKYGGSGWSEYITLDYIKVIMEKQKVKQKIL